MRSKIRTGRTFAVPDTVESLLHRAKKADANPSDYSWSETLFYRGVIDRHDKEVRRELGATESLHRNAYERGFAEMESLMEDVIEKKKA